MVSSRSIRAFFDTDALTSSFQTQGTRWFPIFAGAVVGLTAALLWSAQGSIMMSYPAEKDKGKAFGIFWAIFQFGSFIGSVIALAINLKDGSLGSVSNSTYTVSSLKLLCTTNGPKLRWRRHLSSLCSSASHPPFWSYHQTESFAPMEQSSNSKRPRKSVKSLVGWFDFSRIGAH